MSEPRMPTTLPSPVDRTEFRFAAVDAAGRTWRWIDDEIVWVRVDDGDGDPEASLRWASCTDRRGDRGDHRVGVGAEGGESVSPGRRRAASGGSTWGRRVPAFRRGTAIAAPRIGGCDGALGRSGDARSVGDSGPGRQGDRRFPGSLACQPSGSLRYQVNV